MPIVSTTKLSAQQFLQLGEDPPGVRLELVDGEVAVSPSPTPRHSFVVIKLARILDTYITDNDLGELYQDVDTPLDQYNVRRPDLLYFSKDRTHLVGEKAMEGPPDLAIEVISPSSVEIDREDKFKQYQVAGVMNYWIIDPTKRTVEAWVLEGSEYVSAGGVMDRAWFGCRRFRGWRFGLSSCGRSDRPSESSSRLRSFAVHLLR